MRTSVLTKEPHRTESLYLYIEFYDLPEDSLSKLSNLFLDYIEMHYSQECICDYTRVREGDYRGPSCSSFETFRKKLLPGQHYYFEGYVTSNLIYNRKSYSDYKRYTMYGHGLSEGLMIPKAREYYYAHRNEIPPMAKLSINGKRLFGSENVSLDYIDYIEKLIELCRLGNREDIKNYVYDLYNLPDKHPVGFTPYESEISGILTYGTSGKCSGNKTYSGKIEFTIKAYCLENAVNECAEDLKKLALKMAEITSNLNAYVFMGAPVGTDALNSMGHTRVFYIYGNKNLDGDGTLTPEEWYRKSTLKDACWFNIIGKDIIGRYPLLREVLKSKNADVYVNDFTDYIAVGLESQVTEATIENYRELRRLLYNIIIPGRSELSYSSINDGIVYSMPRVAWEMLPLFREEIDVTDTGIILSHNWGVPQTELARRGTYVPCK